MKAIREKACILDVQAIGKSFHDENGILEVLKDINLQLAPHEFVSLIGPSGSGKTTLLRIIAGLIEPTSGKVVFQTSREPRIGIVFQQANLMPWRSVLGNITLPLEVLGMPMPEAEKDAREWIKLAGLQGFENTWPRDLSGGMAQRVAIARALVQDPDLLLLDEPFGSLDALTRERMGAELLRIWQTEKKTVLMVTHSISEALLLSDRIVVLSKCPGTLILNLDVKIKRPRSDEMRYSPSFQKLARRLRSAIAGID